MKAGVYYNCLHEQQPLIFMLTSHQHLRGHLQPVGLHSPTSLTPRRWAAVILLH